MTKTTDSDNLRYNLVNGKLVDNYTNAKGIVVGSDFHGGSGLENLLSIANSNNLVAVVNGDVVNDYNFASVAQQMGYKTQSEMRFDYFNEKLSEQEIQTYFFIENLQKTGGDISPFLNNVPKENQTEFKKQLEEVIKYSQNKEFSEKINSVNEKFIKEKGDEITENTAKNQLFYQVFMDAEAQNMASKLNKYSDTKVLFNKGNHENTMFVEQVRQYLTNKEQIVDLTEFEGLYTIKQENNQEMTLAGMTNSVQNMPYLSEIMSDEELGFMYSHMNIDDIKKKSIMSGNKSKDDLKNLEKLIKQDSDYNKIFKENEKSLDIFLTHGQVGMPVFENPEKQGIKIPYHGVAAYLSDKAKLTVEGHIHSYFEGKNSFGDNMIRPAGRYGSIIKKDEKGNLITKKIELDSNYTSGQNNPIEYDLDKMKLQVETMYQQLIAKQNSVDDYNGNSDSKAA